MRDDKGRILKGTVAHNKDCASKIKKLEKFHLQLPILCKTHGEHLKWRLHSGNNVQCRLCMCDWQKDSRKRHPFKYLLKYAKTHAKKSNRVFDIDIKFLKKVILEQNGCCVLTGEKFDEVNIPSIDRINSSIGYTKENVQLILIKVNRMKSDLCQDEFIELCGKIYKKKG